VEKKQYELCLEVLKRFQNAGILKDIILIGSWCVYFYKYYFTKSDYADHITVKTRDIDFLIPTPLKTKKKVDVPGLLEDLGFIIDQKGSKGYIKLDHPALIIEFLVPERGKGIDHPYPLPTQAASQNPFSGFSVGSDVGGKVALTNTLARFDYENLFAAAPDGSDVAQTQTSGSSADGDVLPTLIWIQGFTGRLASSPGMSCYSMKRS
jgi:hypothetical protein